MQTFSWAAGNSNGALNTGLGGSVNPLMLQNG
jgi:hypothetical protein